MRQHQLISENRLKKEVQIYNHGNNNEDLVVMLLNFINFTYSVNKHCKCTSIELKKIDIRKKQEKQAIGYLYNYINA